MSSPSPSNESGYAHPQYAQSLSQFGNPRQLARSGGWILEREIPGTSERDAMGCYPLFACEDWLRLPEDLEDLRGELISLSMVTDPFGEYTADDLHRCFRDLVIPFKDHFIVDLSRTPQSSVAAHHRRNAVISRRSLVIESCEVPLQFLDQWCALYDTLVERHTIKGLQTFSRSSFARQLSVPGLAHDFQNTTEGAFDLPPRLPETHATASVGSLGASDDQTGFPGARMARFPGPVMRPHCSRSESRMRSYSASLMTEGQRISKTQAPTHSERTSAEDWSLVLGTSLET